MEVNRVHMKKLSVNFRNTYLTEHFPHEEILTKRFLEALAENYRVRSYEYTHHHEATNGCDWFWIIVTNQGVFYFAVQAKKLKAKCLRRNQVRYARAGHKLQITRLCTYASQVDALPIYVLYSNRINLVNGCSMRPETKEGVFFDYAPHVQDLCEWHKLRNEKPFPISCLFTYISQRCSYANERGAGQFSLCESCGQCEYMEHCNQNKRLSCAKPFHHFFQSFFKVKIPNPKSINDFIIIMLFAEGLLNSNRYFLSYCVNELLEQHDPLAKRIVVQDYTRKHETNYAAALMGEEFRIDTESVLTVEIIQQELLSIWKHNCIFTKLGIFGSYANPSDYDKQTQRKKPDGDSDIDVVFSYKYDEFKTETDLLRIPQFFRTVIRTFKKNVDFVDFDTCDEAFRQRIEDRIIWLDLKKV